MHCFDVCVISSHVLRCREDVAGEFVSGQVRVVHTHRHTSRISFCRVLLSDEFL